MEELIETFVNIIKSSDDQEVLALKESKVRTFCESNGQCFSFEHINAALRDRFICSLLDELSISSENSSSKYRAHCLQALRVLSRDRSNLGEMISEKSCVIFLRLSGLYSDDSRSLETVEVVISTSMVVIEALKCVCNLVYQNAEFREYVVKHGCTKAVCGRLAWFGHSDLPRDVKFFDLRLLFVLTALEANERTAALKANAVELLTTALGQTVPGCEERKELLNKELAAQKTGLVSTLPSR